MKIDGYDLDILVQGYPGRAVCHGGLGWSTIVTIRHGSRLAMVDCGAFGMRKTLQARLKERGLSPKDVTDLLLTHSHYDHSVNWTLFRQARIVIGQQEMDWALNEPWGESVVPELYVRELKNWPTAVQVKEGDEIFPGMTAYDAPGHTPGHLIFVLRGGAHDIIFTGDAAKNRAELICGDTDATFDAAASRASIERIWEFWRAKPGSIVIPGHDLPMRLDNGAPAYLGKREAAISAWFGDDMETTTTLSLTLADTYES